MATILWLVRVFFAQWIVLIYPGVFVFWFIVHNNIDKLRPVGPRAYIAIAGMSWLITAGPLLYFRREIFSTALPVPEFPAQVLAGLGIAGLVTGILIFRKARNEISIRTMIGLPEIEPQKRRQPMLESGIYSRTRNPIYLAHWLLVLSAAALTNFLANWILFALDCVILPLLIRAEERELLARYGSGFAAYMRRVPRFFPQLR